MHTEGKVASHQITFSEPLSALSSQPLSTSWYYTLRNKEYWYNMSSQEIICFGPPSCLMDSSNFDSIPPDFAYHSYDPHSNWYGPGYYLSIILGCALLCIQSVDLLLSLLPQNWLNGSPILQDIVTPASIKVETSAKKAASYRMSQMIGNAITVHEDTKKLQGRAREQKSLNTSFSESGISVQFDASVPGERFQHLMVLRQFQLQENKTEATGGFVWIWKKILDGSIFDEQGIFFHGRLLACNFAQFAVLFFIAYFAVVVLSQQSTATYSRAELANNAAIANLSNVLSNEFSNSTSLQSAYASFLVCLGLQTNETLKNYYENPLHLAAHISNQGGFGNNSILQRCNVSEPLANALEYSQQLNNEWQSSPSLSAGYSLFASCASSLNNISDSFFSDPEGLVQELIYFGGVQAPITQRTFFSGCNVSGQLLTWLEALQSVLAFVNSNSHEYQSLLACMDIVKNTDPFYQIVLNNYEAFAGYLRSSGGVEKLKAEGKFAACNASNQLVTFLYQGEQVYNNTQGQRWIASVFSDLGLTRKDYRICSVVGLLAGILAAVFVWLVHIPSFISTVLKFRSGAIPSLNDRDFLRYRHAPDVVTVLFGSAFWGVLFTATAAGLVAALCVSPSLPCPVVDVVCKP